MSNNFKKIKNEELHELIADVIELNIDLIERSANQAKNQKTLLNESLQIIDLMRKKLKIKS